MVGLHTLDSMGKTRGLLVLFFPILLMNFSNYLFLIVEKILLARLSVQDMEAAVASAYACQIMQIPCVAIAAMTQVFVGKWYGAQDLKSIGPGVWQFIWFSLLSVMITVPFNFAFGSFYFHHTAIEEIVWPYFSFLVCVNFLFPLGTTLTCFYLGLGKTRLILFASIGSQLIKLLLTYILIFGLGDWIPSLGLMGGAISTLVAQGFFCLVLMMTFLQSKNVEKYHVRYWKFQPKLFGDCIYPSLSRAASRISMLLSWVSITYLMTAKGGDYLLALSIGGTLFLFLPCFGDAVCQAQITVLSNILGAKKYHLLNTAFRSALIIVLGIIALLTIPLVLFPLATFHYFFPKIILAEETIKNIFLGVWASVSFFTFSFIPISYILAFKDTKFMYFIGASNWIYGYLLMYAAIIWMQMPADQFWLVLTLMHATAALLYYWRMKWLERKLLSLNTPQIALNAER